MANSARRVLYAFASPTSAAAIIRSQFWPDASPALALTVGAISDQSAGEAGAEPDACSSRWLRTLCSAPPCIRLHTWTIHRRIRLSARHKVLCSAVLRDAKRPLLPQSLDIPACPSGLCPYVMAIQIQSAPLDRGGIRDAGRRQDQAVGYFRIYGLK